MKALSIQSFSACVMIVLNFPSEIYALQPASLLKQLAESNAERPDEAVIWIEADINADGSNDLLVTTQSNQSDEDIRDFEWQIYSGHGNGRYTRARNMKTGQSLISMRLERCWIGYLPELKKHGLLHLVSGNGGQAKCQLIAVILSGPSFEEVPIDEPVSAEDHFETYNRRIQSEGHPKTSKATVEQLKGFQEQAEFTPEWPPEHQDTPAERPFPLAGYFATDKAPDSEPVTSLSGTGQKQLKLWSFAIVSISALVGMMYFLLKRSR